jgi:hypothetical protein
MALTGLTLIENFNWFSPRDTSENEIEKTRFVLGAIPGDVRASIQDNAVSWVQSDQGMQMINKTATRNYELVRFGLREIHNFRDSRGNDIAVEFVDRVLNGRVHKVVSDKTLDLIDVRDITGMADALVDANSPSEDLRKK